MSLMNNRQNYRRDVVFFHDYEAHIELNEKLKKAEAELAELRQLKEIHEKEMQEYNDLKVDYGK